MSEQVSSMPTTGRSLDSFYRECRRIIKMHGLLSVFPVFTSYTDNPENFHKRTLAASRNVRDLQNSGNFITMNSDFEVITAKRIK